MSRRVPRRRVRPGRRASSARPASAAPRERQAARSFFAGAVEITPDKQGRVAVPQHLREYAHLDREVMVAGSFDHIEIWDAQMFAERDAAGIASIVEGEGINDFL